MADVGLQGKPRRESLDNTDKRLSKLLSVDAQDSVNQLAHKMQLSAPTVRGRLRAFGSKTRSRWWGCST